MILIRILARPIALVAMLAVVEMIGLSPGSRVSAQSNTIEVRSGASVDLGPVYWILDCKSKLVRFGAIDIVNGPPGITLTIREEQVYARRQNCRDKVPGGTVVLSATGVESKESGTLEYRVHYDTEDGHRESFHTRNIVVYPTSPSPLPISSPSPSPSVLRPAQI